MEAEPLLLPKTLGFLGPVSQAYLFTYHVRPSLWGSPLRQGTFPYALTHTQNWS